MERVGRERDVGGGWWGLVGGWNVQRRHKLPAKRRGSVYVCVCDFLNCSLDSPTNINNH